MGTTERRARKHAAIETLILDTAEGLLRVSGPDRMSLRAVAERIEYSAAAIYGYFPTKDDLFAALASRGFRRLNRALMHRSEGSDSSPLGRLRELFWRYYEFSKTDGHYYELMFLDLSYEPSRWDTEALACIREATAEADRLISCCVATGDLASGQAPGTVRRILWAAAHGAAVIGLRKRLPASVEPDSLAAETLDAALAGCRIARKSGATLGALPGV